MNETLSLPQIIARIAQLTGADEQTVSFFIKEFIDSLENSLSQGQGVKLKNFGHFFMSANDIRFTADKTLAEAVNQPFAAFEAIELPDDLSAETLAKLNAMVETQTQDDAQAEDVPGPSESADSNETAKEDNQTDLLEQLHIPRQAYSLESEPIEEMSLADALKEIQGTKKSEKTQEETSEESTEESTEETSQSEATSDLSSEQPQHADSVSIESEALSDETARVEGETVEVEEFVSDQTQEQLPEQTIVDSASSNAESMPTHIPFDFDFYSEPSVNTAPSSSPTASTQASSTEASSTEASSTKAFSDNSIGFTASEEDTAPTGTLEETFDTQESTSTVQEEPSVSEENDHIEVPRKTPREVLFFFDLEPEDEGAQENPNDQISFVDDRAKDTVDFQTSSFKVGEDEESSTDGQANRKDDQKSDLEGLTFENRPPKPSSRASSGAIIDWESISNISPNTIQEEDQSSEEDIVTDSEEATQETTLNIDFDIDIEDEPQHKSPRIISFDDNDEEGLSVDMYSDDYKEEIRYQDGDRFPESSDDGDSPLLNDESANIYTSSEGAVEADDSVKAATAAIVEESDSGEDLVNNEDSGNQEQTDQADINSNSNNSVEPNPPSEDPVKGAAATPAAEKFAKEFAQKFTQEFVNESKAEEEPATQESYIVVENRPEVEDVTLSDDSVESFISSVADVPQTPQQTTAKEEASEVEESTQTVNGHGIDIYTDSVEEPISSSNDNEDGVKVKAESDSQTSKEDLKEPSDNEKAVGTTSQAPLTEESRQSTVTEESNQPSVGIDSADIDSAAEEVVEDDDEEDNDIIVEDDIDLDEIVDDDEDYVNEADNQTSQLSQVSREEEEDEGVSYGDRPISEDIDLDTIDQSPCTSISASQAEVPVSSSSNENKTESSSSQPSYGASAYVPHNTTRGQDRRYSFEQEEDEDQDDHQERRINPWRRWAIVAVIFIVVLLGCLGLLSKWGYKFFPFLAPGQTNPIEEFEPADEVTEEGYPYDAFSLEGKDQLLDLTEQEVEVSESAVEAEEVSVEDANAAAAEAKVQAEAKAKRDAEEKAKREAEEKARKQAEEKRIAEQRERERQAAQAQIATQHPKVQDQSKAQVQQPAQPERAQVQPKADEKKVPESQPSQTTPTQVDRRFANGPVYDTVSENRSLAMMAADYYGSSYYWVYIYEENPYLGNPTQIMNGTKVVIPPLSKYVSGSPSDSKNIQAARRKAESINSMYGN